MERTQITEAIVTEARKYAGDDAICWEAVTKNNGIKLNALVIPVSRGAGKTVGACVYIDDAIEKIEKGELTIRQTAKQTVDFARKEVPGEDEGVESIVDSLLRREEILSKIHRELVNRDMNGSILAGCPHKDFCDLAIMYRVVFSEKMSVRVTNHLAENAGITLEELDEAAVRNDDYVIKGMFEILAELTGDHIAEASNDDCMKVITNERKLFGASVLTNTPTLEAVAESFNDDLYIFPSSIHEVIAVPKSFGGSVQEMREMVQIINANEVEPEEVLSDSVYVYDRMTCEVKLA